MKLAIIDQSFHWPPTGGSWVDLRETCLQLQKTGIEPRIFVPVWKRWNIDGGNFDMDPGVAVEKIPVKPKQFNFFQLPKILSDPVLRWKPDSIMITNTFYMAPYIINEFPNIPVFLRIYAHELLCMNYMNVSKCDVFNWVNENPNGDICGKSLITNPIECWMCGLRRLGGTLIGPRLNPVAAEYWSSLAFSPFYSQTVKKSLAKTTGIIVYNPAVKSMLGNIKTKIHVVPGAVDPERFRPSEITELPLKNNKPIKILMSGRLDDQRKGFSVFESAIKLLRKNANTDTRFEAFVTDSRTDFSHPFIKNAGWITTDKLPELYRSMDIIVCPSIWPEPFGLIVLEAMASAKPVVASRIGGMKYSIINNETGLHFEPGNAAELAEHLLKLIENKELRQKMGSNALERVKSRFTWSKVVKKYTEPILRGTTRNELDWTRGDC